MQSARFFLVTCDEVTTANNGTWISIHVYVVREFQRYHMLVGAVGLERVDDGVSSNNLTKVIIAIVQEISGLGRDEIAQCMVCFGVGKISVLKSCSF
jgi:hypothetical protein